VTSPSHALSDIFFFFPCRFQTELFFSDPSFRGSPPPGADIKRNLWPCLTVQHRDLLRARSIGTWAEATFFFFFPPSLSLLSPPPNPKHFGAFLVFAGGPDFHWLFFFPIVGKVLGFHPVVLDPMEPFQLLFRGFHLF